jgi:hypothetical protein
MPSLSNPRWEAFTANVANGQTQYDSYVNAGFEGNPSAASQLAKRPEIKARIHELIQERQQKRRDEESETDTSISDLDREWILKQLKKNIQTAQGDGNITAANKAVELLMEMLGFGKKPRGGAPDEGDKPAKPTGGPTDNAMQDIMKKLEALRTAPPGDDEAEAEEE